ncbi:MAG: hypothetical protein JO097_12665 [Acidobacteriaceae bacterium]|nr:hypothetical protein [Acidobacteriaceae bacterium]MBV9295347.1 hypothetical protein [Acidobacteriaceae bacterium]MBV9764678.1 hypothetical protein [Acidobacteriaceae bacterium]
MPRMPSSRPDGLKCDQRLVVEAIAYRRTCNPPLLSLEALGKINVTAWLYLDELGVKRVKVNPNITIVQIREEFGRAPTRDAETGIHSEGIAAQFFKENQRFRVLQIFSERIPCKKMCAPMLNHYFSGVPWFYYYDRASWHGNEGELIKRAGEALKVAYGL